MLTGFIGCPLISKDMLDSAMNAVESEYNRNKVSYSEHGVGLNSEYARDCRCASASG